MPPPPWWLWVRAALFLVTLATSGLFLLPVLQGRPVYDVQNGQITARGIQAQTVIPKDTPVTREQIDIRRKIIGSHTPGYTIGRFQLTPFGRAALYTDGSHDALVFRTAPRLTVLTPADPDELLRAWRGGETRLFRPARVATISAATLLPLLLLLPLLVFFARHPRLVYEWEPDALIVRTGLSRTGTTRAELTEEGLGLRLFGAAVPGYFTGTFSVKSAGGGRVQAYATSARPGRALLLHLDSTTYYLTPVNPQAALQQFHVH
ncbi:hypothetical protein GCM10008956_31550 [Deinococcus arenae]|uniref:Bacterial Pleckstrin homology domain-containing protein n=1 Tax=Deinococcus arenae TaxID=1452751 RepID=A0A8H9L7H1_9DEIO|nr:hypothetical protein GCM10008956_31550 [Deinococcus arenae]